MSHQTQIERVGPSWAAFIARWPAPADLAEASTRDLLEVWSGLGYNRRALALREASRAIVEFHGGRVPRDIAALEALPGIGRYTARAVVATAFGEPVAPVDVNIRRVLGRITGTQLAPAAAQLVGDAAISRDDPRGWVNGVMDLAATVCRAREPRCDACPVASVCRSRGIAPAAPRARATAGAGAGTGTPFRATNRWLRGQLLRELRATPPGVPVLYETSVGHHGPAAVREALAQLEREGFVELGSEGARISSS